MTKQQFAQLENRAAHAAAAKAEISEIATEAPRGAHHVTSFFQQDSNGRGAWDLDVIVLRDDNSIQGGLYSVRYDNDMDVTYSIDTYDELMAVVDNINTAVKDELDNARDSATEDAFFELFEPADNQDAADAAEEAWRNSPEYAAHKAAEAERVQSMLKDGVDTGEDMAQHKGESNV